jgi:predicted TIM-barrel fold metal-dependent hydrolase
MRNGLVIIDADGHAVDQEPIYRERLPERFRKAMRIFPSDGFDRNQNGTINKAPRTPRDNLRDNDVEGIDLQIIYPTAGLFHSRVRDHDLAIALAEAYNDWLYDWCAIDRKRLKGVAMVPLHVDVQAAIKEMDRAVGKLGAVGVMVNTFDRNRNVAHRDFWPFYEECARQGVAVGFHASGSDTLDSLCHFDTFLAIHTLSHAPEQLIACTAVIYSGLLERYQDLRVAFLEAGIGWVPFWMEHMDEEYELREFDAPLLTAKPSEYLACGRVFVSCEPEEKTLRYVPEFFPAENILYASDYPHWDGGFPYTVATLADRTDISDQLKRKIFFDNPRRFYGLEVSPADYGTQQTLTAV